MDFRRRQFLKISSGAIGTAVATEATSLGANVSPVKDQTQKVPIQRRKQIASICPYCVAGCGQIGIVSDEGQIIDIQGNPDSPINQGTLCLKGATAFQLVNNDLRVIP
jgi:formate dehydrogenase major subunit